MSLFRIQDDRFYNHTSGQAGWIFRDERGDIREIITSDPPRRSNRPPRDESGLGELCRSIGGLLKAFTGQP